MDYLSQKIKSLTRLEPDSKMHRDIMRRVLYLRFRKFKEPFLILAYLGVIGVMVDGWHILASKSQGIQHVLTSNFSYGMSSVFKLPAAILIKGLANPDLLVGFIADALIVAYLLYLFIRFDKIFNPASAQNRTRWSEAIFRLFRPAKN